MNIQPFLLERLQSVYENTVEYNLTESGFHPFTLQELLTPEELNDITSTVLGYGQTNGSIPLRETIAQLYSQCTGDNILVTNGSSEANFVACRSLLQKGRLLLEGDEAVDGFGETTMDGNEVFRIGFGHLF